MQLVAMTEQLAAAVACARIDNLKAQTRLPAIVDQLSVQMASIGGR